MRVICPHCKQPCRRRKDGTAGQHHFDPVGHGRMFDCLGIGKPGAGWAIPGTLNEQHDFAMRVMVVQEEYLRDHHIPTGPDSEYRKIMHAYLVAMVRVLNGGPVPPRRGFCPHRHRYRRDGTLNCSLCNPATSMQGV